MAKEIKDAFSLLSLIAATALLIGVHAWIYVQ